MSGLVIKDVSMWYGRFQALHNVTLPEIKKGELVGLLGPNAAGKSTLLHALTWPGKARHKITYQDQNISSLRSKQRIKTFGLMSQTPPQPSSLTPFELLWSLARALDLPLSDQALQNKAEQLFDKFGLADDAFKSLHALSGGKRQLVGVIMVLLRSPEIFLLDEPTSALDLHWRLIVLSELQNYIRAGEKLAIAAMHDLTLAAHFCDKLALLNAGKLMAYGTPREVLTNENLAKVFQVESKVYLNADQRLSIDIIGPHRGAL